MAEWLDTVFAGFDFTILRAIHEFAVATGGFFTPLMYFVSIFAWKGLGMVLLGAALLFPRRTRRVGVCILLAVLLGALVTNLLLKPTVARARPYAGAGQITDWWIFAGGARESDLSFPSGHTTATAAAMVALFLSFKRRYAFPALIFALLMGFSRMYLMVHYPTDVLAGLLIGALAAVAAFFAVRALFRLAARHPENRFCRVLCGGCPADPSHKTGGAGGDRKE